MKKSMYLVAMVLAGAIAGFAQGADAGNMALENTMLRQRLNDLDNQIQELKANAALQGSATGAQKPVWSKLDIQLYGYLKLDAAYDTSRIDNGNYAKWVFPESPNSDDDQFNMTANETRLGFMVSGPKSNGMVTSGKVEIDFYGPGDGVKENQARLMMRHAFIKLDWPEDKFSIIAGQTSDVISPLVPSTINYSVCWWTGNIGYRRPQIRLTKECTMNDIDLKFEGALARTIGRTSVTLTDSGEDAGFPTWQGRVSATLPIFSGKETTVGLSAHIGEEEYDIASSGDNTDFESWSVNLDVTQPVCDKVSVKGELFTGENLDAYLGGIGQGVNTSTMEEINSAGGWVAASVGPWKNKNFNFGLAIDDVDRGEVSNGGRTFNRSIFGNMIYSLNENTDLGFELSHWKTDYRGPGDGDSLRAQVALKYKF